MSKFLTVNNEILLSNSKGNEIKIEARAIKLNLFDENDLPYYPIYEVFNEKFPSFITISHPVSLLLILNPFAFIVSLSKVLLSYPFSVLIVKLPPFISIIFFV